MTRHSLLKSGGIQLRQLTYKLPHLPVAAVADAVMLRALLQESECWHDAASVMFRRLCRNL